MWENGGEFLLGILALHLITPSVLVTNTADIRPPVCAAGFNQLWAKQPQHAISTLRFLNALVKSTMSTADLFKPKPHFEVEGV